MIFRNETTANSSPMPTDGQLYLRQHGEIEIEGFRNLIRCHSRVAFDCKPLKAALEETLKAAASGATSSSVSSSFRSSDSDESLQLDISRYDNVSPQSNISVF